MSQAFAIYAIETVYILNSCVNQNGVAVIYEDFDLPLQIVFLASDDDVSNFHDDCEAVFERHEEFITALNFVPEVSSSADCVRSIMLRFLGDLYVFMNRWNSARMPLGIRETINHMEISLGFPPTLFSVTPFVA